MTALTRHETAHYMDTFNEFWADLVTDETGQLDKDQVARELADAKMFMDHLVEVYMHFSRGNISKPNTLPSEVIAIDDRYRQRDYIERAELESWIEDGPMAEHGAGSEVYDVLAGVLAEFCPEENA